MQSGAPMWLFLFLLSLLHASDAFYPSELTETSPLNPPENLPPTRVPHVFYPDRYWISLRPYFPSSVTYPQEREFTFDGNVTIEFRVLQAARNVTVNQRKLNFTTAQASVSCDNGAPFTVTEVRIMPKEKDQVAVLLDRMLEKGATCNLTINNYKGPLNDFKIASFFRTSYVMPNGTRRWMVASHFEEGGMCRSAIPSFDEPMYKSIYYITLIHPSDLKALANGPEHAPVDLGNGWSSTSFEPVKKMSAYLIAFAIGDFVGVQRVNKHGTLVRAWAWPGMEPYLDVALDTGAKALDWFSDYFNITFPLKKQDLLGLPEFRPGAMENWGLVIFRHQALAWNPHMDTSFKRAASVISTIVHELAHQWFGDLVTAEWWDNLWLHEGQAEYWAPRGSYGIYPEQANIFDITLTTDMLEGGLQFDGVPRRSHPLTDPKGPYFDKITYNKGGSVLRMINHTMSEPLFQMGLQRYLTKHAYGNAVHRDLFDAFTEVAAENGIQDWCGRPMNFTQFLAPWTHQQGFPTIVVRSNGTTLKQVHQKPFQNFTELHLPLSPFDYHWPVPNWYRTVEKDGHYHLAWILPPGAQDECEMPPSISRRDNTVTVENAASRAFARVLYDNATWHPIMEYIRANPNAFDPMTRTQLLNDALVFMKTADVPGYARFMNLSLFLVGDLSLAPWKFSAIREYEQFALDFMQGDLWPSLLLYFSETIAPVYKKLGWTGDTDWDRNALRGEITTLACRFHLGDCMAKAQELFRSQFLAEGSQDGCYTASAPYCSKVDPDLRRAVYSSGVELGTEHEFNLTWANYMAEKTRNRHMTTERDNLLNALTATRRTSSARRVIEYALTNDNGTGSIAFSGLERNPVATAIMWQYLQENLRTVLGSEMAVAYLKAMTASWNNAKQEKLLDTLLADHAAHLTAEQQKLLSNASDNVKAHKNAFEWLGQSIADWLKDRYDNRRPTALYTRIPSQDLQPLWYNLTVRPYWPSGSKLAKMPSDIEWTFDGELFMRVVCRSATNEIYLNAANLSVHYAHVLDEISHEEVPLTVLGVRTYHGQQQINIMLQNGLTAGNTYRVHLKYTGLINNWPDNGLFRSAYIDTSGQKHYILATQFEHIRARAVFPSFDEPEYKTPFLLHLEHPSDLVAIANTPVKNTTDMGAGWQRTTFSVTPPVSSYLTAFVIGNLTNEETTSVNGTLVRVFERPGNKGRLDLTLNIAKRTVEWFNKYLNVEYPLPKLDIVGLSQYKGGGMENWGLVTMRSDITAVDNATDSTDSLAKCVKVTVHEVAHQWFGDLVTMHWWEEVFLNEGFANFWEFDTPCELLPQHSKYFSSRYVPEILSPAQTGDASNSSHALHYANGHDPDFGSAITYDKGGALLRMLRFVLGKDAFRTGLQTYMHAYAFKNTNHYNLFNEMTKAAKQHNILDWCGQPLNVTDFMNPWLMQRGFPVVFIESQPSETFLSQTPYNDVSMLPPSPYNYQWPIPVWYTATNGSSIMSWLLPEALAKRCNKTSLSLTLPARALQLTEARTYAVTDWDPSSWAQLLNTFLTKPQSLHVNMRAQTLSDLQLLARRDPSYNKRLLRMAQYLAGELSLAPWDTMKPAFVQWEKAARQAKQEFLFRSYLLQLYVPVYNALGWDIVEDDWDKNILRMHIIKRTCELDYTACLNEANKRLDAFLSNLSAESAGVKWPHADIQEAVFCGGVRAKGDAMVWQRLFTVFKEHARIRPLTLVARRLLRGLVCTKQSMQLSQLINYAMRTSDNSSDVFDDRKIILDEVKKHQQGASAMWQYWQQAGSTMVEHPLAEHFIDSMTERWSSTDELQRVRAFLGAFVSQTSQLESLYADNAYNTRKPLLQRLLERVQSAHELARAQSTPLSNYLQYEQHEAPPM